MLSMPHVIGLALLVCVVKQNGTTCLKSGFFIRRIDFLYLIIAIIFVLFSVIAFAAPFEKNTVFWLSYGFGVLAMAAQLIVQPRALDLDGHDVRSKFYGFPLTRIATAYLAVQLVLSLVFMILCKNMEIKTWVPLIAYVLIFGISAIGFISADAMKEEVERQDTVHKANVGAMRALQSKAVFVASQCEDAETKKALDSFSEALRFSDPASNAATVDIEENLTGLLEELGSAVLDKDYPAARTLCAKASALLADRNRMCKLNK